MEWTDRRETWSKQAEDARDDYAVDFGRIIHSGSFRRLQGKTQILNLGESDFYRTRLTHSLEVAQIAGNLARQLAHGDRDHPGVPYLPEISLIQAVGLTHDLGHPPFGHGGEVALNYCMRGAGGFEGNGQTLRILSRFEKFSKAAGANLTRRAMLGALKYPVPFSRVVNPAIEPRLLTGPWTLSLIDREASKPPKCFLDTEQDVVDWILAPLTEADRERFVTCAAVPDKHGKPQHKSFDCSIMDVADDIAYGVHDLEDALALDLVREDEFRSFVSEADCAAYLDVQKAKYPTESANNVYETMTKKLFGGDGGERKHAISRIVHHFVTNCRIETDDRFAEPLLRYRAAMAPEAQVFLKALTTLVRERVISSPAVQQIEFKGQRMVVAVFETFLSEPNAFLPRDAQTALDKGTPADRVICDHVAGMADGFLLKTYDRLFSPRMGSVFDRL